MVYQADHRDAIERNGVDITFEPLPNLHASMNLGPVEPQVAAFVQKAQKSVVTARLVRRSEERRDERPDGTPVFQRHELWFAIPLRSTRRARRQIDSFFAEVLPAAV